MIKLVRIPLLLGCGLLAVACGNDAPEALFADALAAQEAGALDRAISRYDKLLDTDPAHGGARLNRGIARLSLGQPDAALADFDELLEGNPTDADALLNRGAALQELDRLDDAVAAYDRLLDVQPDNVTAWSNRADIWASVQQWDRAAADYTSAIRLTPDEPELFALRAQVHERQGRQAAADLDRALALLTDYLWQDESAADARIDRAALFAELGEVDLAVRDADIAMTLAPERTEFALVRGDMLRLLGELSEARDDFTAVIALQDPALSSQALVGRAQVYRAIGSARETLADYEAAHALTPTDASIAAELAWLKATHPQLLDAGGAERAAMAALKAFLAEPDTYPDLERWYFEDVLAAAMARAGRYDAAADRLQQAAGAAPDPVAPLLTQRAAQYRTRREPITDTWP